MNNNKLPTPIPKYNNGIKCWGKTPDITKFINELRSMGVDMAVSAKHSKPNQIDFSIKCRQSPKDVEIVTKLLFSLFGV